MATKRMEYEAISKATVEFFKTGKIDTKCPRCGGTLECKVYGNSYDIICTKENAILESARGV